MAISLAKARRVGQQRTTSKKLSKEYAAQAKKAQKRKGISGLLGKGLGAVIGSGLMSGLTIASGGLLAPLVMAAGSFGGKKIAHELTRGMGAKTGGLKGDMYGYGEEEAMSLKKDLQSQMAVDPLKERGGFGKDLLSSYISAGMAGNLGGVKGALTKGGGGSEQLLGIGKYGTGAEGTFGERFTSGVGDLFGTKWGSDEAADMPILTDDSQLPLTQEELSQSQLFGGEYESIDPSMTINPELDEEGWSITGEQGGQVPQQQQLLALLALAEMQQNNAYSGTPLEEKGQQQTISEMFESKGKTLGGNNTQSLSQMLGR